MRSRRPLLSDVEGTREIWPAFTDVMSTMALILFVLVLLAYVRSVIGAKRMGALERDIAASEQRLHAVRDELDRTAARVALGDAELAASRARLHDQEATIADSNRQLDDLRQQLQSIAVLRVSVLEKLRQAVDAELRATHPDATQLATIGDNGDILLGESLLFEYGSYAIKKDARPLLDSLARALGNLLADPAVRANIDTILIQGHADERGSDSYNWDLSARRATTVLDYLFEANKTLADSYGSTFAASAYSKYRPVDASKSQEAYQRNRRIEIAVIPRDANVRKVIEDYARSAPPAPSSVPPAPPSPSSPPSAQP
jgi:chemotaxis protein MotB